MHDLDQIQAEWPATASADPYEQQEAELASQLLAVSNEYELEQFIGKALGQAVRAAGNVLRSDVGRAVGGVVKDAVRGTVHTALPQLGGVLGGAAGGRFGYGDVGARIGERLGSAALKGLGMGELEGGFVDDETQFEVARQIVRFAGETARRAAAAPAGVDPRQAALSAAAAAARQVAHSAPAATTGGGSRRTGRWVRKGQTIVLTQV